MVRQRTVMISTQTKDEKTTQHEREKGQPHRVARTKALSEMNEKERAGGERKGAGLGLPSAPHQQEKRMQEKKTYYSKSRSSMQSENRFGVCKGWKKRSEKKRI